MKQLFFEGLELIPEAEAAQELGMDMETIQDLRHGHWKGVGRYQEHDGEIFYVRADVLALRGARRTRKNG